MAGAVQYRQKMERLMADLGQGCYLEKLKPRKKHKRKYFLDYKNMTVYYEGSKRKKVQDTKIPISKIKEVREGEKEYAKHLQDLNKSKCFTIILGNSHKMVYLLTDSEEMREKWVKALRYAMQLEQLAEQKNESNKIVREAFNKADLNGDGHLDFEEVLKLLKSLNTDIKKKYARVMFDEADKNKNVGVSKTSVLDREEFVEFYNRLTKRVELEDIFLKFSNGKGYMNIRDILGFLRDGQKIVDANEDQCRNIIDQFEPEGRCKKSDLLSVDGFRQFLISEREQLFNPSHRVVYQDMTRPMTHYFIASSHNTYLAEDQLRGPSQVEMYISALKKGCRCVELDCWDGPDGQPVIYHGYTLTSKILFEDVIRAINNYAFQASPYPVTLSIENHCSVEQQERMAQIMTSVFGDKIWSTQTDLIRTPTPEDLRNKIIIKGKRLPSITERDADVSDEDEAADIPNNETSVNNNKTKRNSKIQKIKLSPALSKITSMKSVGFKTLEQSAQPDSFFSVVSLSESKVERFIQTNPLELNKVTHNRLIRTYPAGSRTDSSNYIPMPMWVHGCQVVALNYQTGGKAMQLNQGRFMDNGGVGYVLKPPFLLSEERFKFVTGNLNRSANSMRNVKLTIISGFQFPKPKNSQKGEVIDPFVKVSVHGVAADEAKFRTKVIQNNGFNPRWYETFSFKVKVPELALLRFTVKDQDPGKDDFIGYYCIPLSSIQEGYRHFPLYDKHDNIYRQSLIFIHITISSA
ncbi:1-phosphatidylinositol 4,5-bisphosphate phosphodiesterase delta-4-like isoform X4 [Biomphalaria glabrata]|uniref:Phosphoinositide phospholipase C n=1 Tax=Biomphalaria glabrata TaxID=6526 RepID=A0A9W3BIS6_BIOGL|nr:1-phosphatidylinositol 4,5-bisphosphate phosphodiesterase delta-4-like isoform X4 [Biomphalaria glabrata]